MKNNAQSLMIKIFFGGSLLIIGTAALVNNFYDFNLWEIVWKWWPVFVILYGLAQLITQPKTFLGALFILGFGVIALLNTIGIIDVNPFSLVVPLILIFIGLRIVFNSAIGKMNEENQDNFFNSVAIFGASDIVSSSNKLEGGMVNCLFGGAKIDLRKAKMAEKGAVIDLTAAFGGVDIIIPSDWQVRFDVIPVFGGWENKSEGTEGPILTIKGLIAFGGAEIKTKDDGR